MSQQAGATDPRELVRENCTENESEMLVRGEQWVNEEKYRERCEEVEVKLQNHCLL